ncbi:AAA family ATPase [Nocardia sp. NBC_01503]|uniref:AAA family ATPase n=1 Tax=Nocardia sp. NBC_01503 TaxID=2975997 RepID=UPI002E7B8573|nr:AAA family ATPase [Nocardia sp. NBC_01503]WTL29424.1 AAA family ATPase [Nocardia sp. NBC_01503]
MDRGPNPVHSVRPAERAWLDGVVLLDRGDHHRAGAAFQAAVGLDPSVADAWLGVHAADQDRRTEAVRAMVLRLARGITDRFLRDESQLYVALALIAQAIHYEALEVLKPLPSALGDYPHFHAEVAYGRGLAHEGLGETDTALRQFQNAYRYSPDYPGLAERIKVRTTTSTAGLPTSAQGESAQPAPAVSDRDEPTPANVTESRDALLVEAMNQLDSTVGMEPVKRQIHTLSAQLRMALLRRAEGLSTAPALRHFVFAGPPGTGKTTVARIIGKILAGLGLLDNGHVIETQRVDLVGQHLGETAIKTTKVIDSALGGVLFIDEAYALANNGYMRGDAYGAEALQVLLKRAEDDRDRLVIVLAGYSEEMTELLATNPGLASRFTTRVEFPSYDYLELFQIALDILDAQADVLTEESADTLGYCCERAVDDGSIDRLGNARFVRELCAKAAARRDLRIADQLVGTKLPSRTEMTTLTSDDITGAFRELLEAVTPLSTRDPDRAP